LQHEQVGSGYHGLVSLSQRCGPQFAEPASQRGWTVKAVPTFFKTLKSELVWRTVFYTRQEADQAIGRYIDEFYNPARRAVPLGRVIAATKVLVGRPPRSEGAPAPDGFLVLDEFGRPVASDADAWCRNRLLRA